MTMGLWTQINCGYNYVSFILETARRLPETESDIFTEYAYLTICQRSICVRSGLVFRISQENLFWVIM